MRHQHHTQSHTQQSRRELHQPVGIGQPAHTAGLQVRSNLGIDQQRYLRHAHTQQSRQHESQDAARTCITPSGAQAAQAQAELGQHAKAQQCRYLHRQLQQAAQHHTRAQRVDGLNAQGLEPGRAQPGGGNHAHIEQHRRSGRHGKALEGVENPGRQRHQGHETDVREHPARHEHSRLKATRTLLQTAGHEPDQHRRPGHSQNASQKQGPDQQTGHPVHQEARGLFTLTLLGGSQHRHKSLTESAFSKQPSKEIRNAKSHIESIRHGTGAKRRSNQQLPRQTGDPRQEREKRYGGSGFKK